MGVQSLFIDAWIREAQEASRLVENLEIKIENNPQQALGDTARSNLFDLGIKLDRLESLLHNPSYIQLRTRVVFQSLYALPSKDRSGNLATGDAKETSATDIGYYQDHTKVTFSQEDLELLIPLITDDAARSQLQITLSNSFALQNLHWRICRVILVILGGGLCFSLSWLSSLQLYSLSTHLNDSMSRFHKYEAAFDWFFTSEAMEEIRQSCRGIYILYEDVKSCQYEDVQILWSILVESNAPTLPSKQ